MARVLHALDSWNIGGIQELVLLISRHSKHKHDVWGGRGTMSPIMDAEGITTWEGGPPADAKYDVYVGHGVGGWSYNNSFRWAKDRGMRTVEVMHSNAKSQTDPSLTDRFVGLSRLAASISGHHKDVRVIYAIVEVDKYARQDPKYIGRLSRLAPEKRPMTFVDLARKFPSEKFAIAGDGALMNDVRRNAPPNLDVLGMIRDFPAFYSSLRLFVFPTKDECCCTSVAMAQAAGVPVICQNIAALQETTGSTASLASTDAEFSDRVADYIRNPTPYEEMAVLGKIWARASFSPEVVSGKWDALIDELT